MAGAQRAVVRGDNVLADGKPKPGAAAGAVTRAFGTVEALKQHRQLFVVDPRCGVGKVQRQAAGAQLAGNK